MEKIIKTVYWWILKDIHKYKGKDKVPGISYVVSEILSSNVLRSIISGISAADILKMSYIVYELLKGKSMEESMFIVNDIFYLKIILIKDSQYTERKCGYCDGHGDIDCNHCGGHGVVDCDYCGTDGCSECNDDGVALCSACSGEEVLTCNHCGGVGEVQTGGLTYTVETEYWVSCDNQLFLKLRDLVGGYYDGDIYDLLDNHDKGLYLIRIDSSEIEDSDIPDVLFTDDIRDETYMISKVEEYREDDKFFNDLKVSHFGNSYTIR